MQRKTAVYHHTLQPNVLRQTNMAASPARPAKLGFKPDSPIALACRLLSNNNSMGKTLIAKVRGYTGMLDILCVGTQFLEVIRIVARKYNYRCIVKHVIVADANRRNDLIRTKC
jgi:hypothetical protein